MYKRKLPIELECGLHLFMEVLSGKWKIGLIWCIYGGIKRPGELHRKFPKVSRRLIDIQLTQLCSHNIIYKIVYDEKIPKVEYKLTELGKTLIPIIEITAEWGELHREELTPLLTTD